MLKTETRKVRDWIDFKAVREAARFEQVLEHYGVEVEKKGSEYVASCPFHEESKPSFRMNVEKQVFHCFGCGAKGNVLDFIAKKEGCSIKDAALSLGGTLGIQVDKKSRPGATSRAEKSPQGQKKDEGVTEASKAETERVPPATDKEVNRPLTFTLKLDPAHPYLKERGVTSELADVFGIGACSKGLLKERIAIPIHDDAGNLVAYMGRWPGEPPEGEERYKLPPGFKKSLVLFNLHRVKSAEHLAIVEGCWSVLRLHSLGLPSVALLGRDLSPRQEALLRWSNAKHITLLLDGDAPGRQAAQELLPRLAHWFFVRVAELPDGTEPDTVPTELLTSLLS